MNDKSSNFGVIHWIKCPVCMMEYPTFTFEGENDMITAGWRDSTDLVNRKLYLFDVNDDFPGGKHVKPLKRISPDRLSLESIKDYLERTKNIRRFCYYYCINCGYENAYDVMDMSESELMQKGFQIECNLRFV